jgi:activating signal cointegrator complex subunit 2
MTNLPPLAPVPPFKARNIIPSEEWEACLESWAVLIELRLRLLPRDFESQALKDGSLVPFLSSYVRQLATASASSTDGLGPLTSLKARNLRKLSFLLTEKLLLLEAQLPPQECLEWVFLGDLCLCYHRSSALRALASRVWEKHQGTVTSSVERAKSTITKRLSLPGSPDDRELGSDIQRLTALASSQPAIGHILMTGSDYLDTLFDVYKAQKSEALRQALVANTYVGFTSLLKSREPSISLLLDHLYSLKIAVGVDSGSRAKETTLLSGLICSSDILTRMERSLTGFPGRRGADLAASLRVYQTAMRPLHRRYQHARKKDKGKGRAKDAVVDGEIPDAHKISLITQILDLFPDLGSGYVLRLLEFYAENVEAVIGHLLENSLPPEFQRLDKTEQLPGVSQNVIIHETVLPRATPPPVPDSAFTRRNVFDDDIVELARSGNAKHRLHFGRADPDLTADAILADRSQHAINKAAILSALVTFDLDDDERDDTYDIADVGGMVDTTAPAGIEADVPEDIIRQRRAQEEADQVEITLFRLYKAAPGQFARDSATRRSQPREFLKRETGMTDEAIEGWAVMLARDPKRESKLERKLVLAGDGPGSILSQRELSSTAYRKQSSKMLAETDLGIEDSDEASDRATSSPVRKGDPTPAGGRGQSDRGGRSHGRGHGRGRGRSSSNNPGGGGSVTGPSGDRETAIARQRKDANKASRANHNRRDQRAKKMARGGGIPS